MKHFLWPDVDGHPAFREKDPELKHMSVALQYGIATVQSRDATLEDLQAIKANIEKLYEGKPTSGYTQSVINALEQRLIPPGPKEMQGFEHQALTD